MISPSSIQVRKEIGHTYGPWMRGSSKNAPYAVVDAALDEIVENGVDEGEVIVGGVVWQFRKMDRRNNTMASNPRESQYADQYLRITGSGRLLTPQTFLKGVLRGRAKRLYSDVYLRSLMRSLNRLGAVPVRSAKGKTAYVLPPKTGNPHPRELSLAGLDAALRKAGRTLKVKITGENARKILAQLTPEGRRKARVEKIMRRVIGNPSADASELSLFIQNDSDLYNRQEKPIQKNLATKKAKGIYRHDLAVKLYGYLVESGAKKYAKEFSVGSDWHRMFPPAVRKEVAEEFASSFETEYGLGNYDQLLPKKYQQLKARTGNPAKVRAKRK